jgi:hypothetical protein
MLLVCRICMLGRIPGIRMHTATVTATGTAVVMLTVIRTAMWLLVSVPGRGYSLPVTACRLLQNLRTPST